jgi:hypothetical protein
VGAAASSSSRLGGLAAPAPARPVHYTPGEFSLELARVGINRSTKWVCREVSEGRIARNPVFKSRIFIPESELLRLAGIKEAAA